MPKNKEPFFLGGIQEGFTMNYVTIYEEYKHKFFQLPKVFFTNDKYLNMSNNAKVAWSLLRDRASLSRKNGWFDKDTGRVYFIFTNEDLMKLLNINSKTTLSNIKKELEKVGLIESHRIGFNKPNKMYLLYPEITEDDVYAIDELEGYEYEEYKRENSSESLGAQGSPENGRPENGLQDVQKMDSSNTDSSNTELKDLDIIDTNIDTNKEFHQNNFKSISDSEKEQLKQQYLEKAFYSNQNKIPNELSNVFKIFCSSTDEAEKYYKSINKAKLDVFNYAIENKGIDLIQISKLENEPELLQKIIDTFVRSIRLIEQKRNINNPTGYVYKAVYRVIWDYFDLSNVENERVYKNEYLNDFQKYLSGYDLN